MVSSLIDSSWKPHRVSMSEFHHTNESNIDTSMKRPSPDISRSYSAASMLCAATMELARSHRCSGAFTPPLSER